MGWKKDEIQAGIYLDGQPLHLQPLVTQCMCDAKDDLLATAKALFDKRKDAFLAKYCSNHQSCIL